MVFRSEGHFRAGLRGVSGVPARNVDVISVYRDSVSETSQFGSNSKSGPSEKTREPS